MKTALSKALPFGLAVTAVIALFSLLEPFGISENQTLMYLSLILISITAVIKSCIPFNLLRSFICVTMTGGIFSALLILPGLFKMSRITPEMGIDLAAAMAAVWGFLGIMRGIKLLFSREKEKRHTAEVGIWQD